MVVLSPLVVGGPDFLAPCFDDDSYYLSTASVDPFVQTDSLLGRKAIHGTADFWARGFLGNNFRVVWEEK